MSDPSPFLRYLQGRDRLLDRQAPGVDPHQIRTELDELRPLLTDGERAYITAQGDWRFTNPPPPKPSWRWTSRVVRTLLILPWMALYGGVCLVGATLKGLQEFFDQLKDDADDVLDLIRLFIKGLR